MLLVLQQTGPARTVVNIIRDAFDGLIFFISLYPASKRSFQFSGTFGQIFM